MERVEFPGISRHCGFCWAPEGLLFTKGGSEAAVLVHDGRISRLKQSSKPYLLTLVIMDHEAVYIAGGCQDQVFTKFLLDIREMRTLDIRCSIKPRHFERLRLL